MAFSKKKKAAGILFDIQKAFDKVWHEGLLFKMHQIKIPNKIGKWIQNFLTNRKFYVSVNGQNSGCFSIYTGVPQGSVLSPILFILFMNDIPMQVPNYIDNESLLYADDLFNFYCDKNLNRINIILQKYLDLLEEWLRKWRLKVAPHKCSYNIYTEHKTCKKELNLKIFGQKINKENNARYLGIYLDNNLNFGHHINQMKDRCLRKLNFLKVLKSKKSSCQTSTKIAVYNALVRSNLDFAGPLFNNISDGNKKKLESIQYHSMRIMLNCKYGASSTEMRERLGISTLAEHFAKLNNKYLSMALVKNQLIADLFEQFIEFENNLEYSNTKQSMFGEY
jgi:hypothetical protein